MARRSRGPMLRVWLLAALLLAATPAVASPPSLFDPPSPGGASTSAARPKVTRRAVVRQRAATARLDVLARPDGSSAVGAGDRVHLNLFDDASFSMTVTDVAGAAGRGLAWSGVLDGVDAGHVVLALHDGAMVGQVLTSAGVYRIGYTADGTQVVEEVDSAALPPEAHSVMPSPSATDAMTLDGGAVEATDTAASIDVMVLYTAAARVAAGGTAAMRAEVSLAVASANQAYANGNLAQRLRLVYAGEIAITETDFTADLDALKRHPLVGWLRDVSRADLVTLITDHGPSTAFCGIGFLMTTNSAAFAANGFSVVERDCATANLSFTHELGHNMGAHHDAFVAGAEPTLAPYSHGYVDTVGRVRTIMAYDDQCATSGFHCPRIPFFSTPGRTYNGRPIGNATSDNARTLGETAATVASFRQALSPPLTLTTGVSQAGFAVGDTLVASVGVSNAGTAPGAVDFYAGLVLPDGTAVFFTDVVIAGDGGHASGSILNFHTYRPIATGVSLGSAFAGSFPSFISYRRTGADPAGGFAFFVLAVTAGALADGALAPQELVGASLSSFSFPAAGKP